MTVDEKLREILSRWPKKHIADDKRLPSAVLVPIYYKEGEFHILFTRRTDNVKEHKGQISFPGGAYQDEDKTLLNTALRECVEEIGLATDAVRILGELDDTLTTTSNYIISPFVGVIPWPYEFKVDGWETNEIIEVPISVLLDKDSCRGGIEIVGGQKVTSYFYHHEGRIIWGATARILHQFLDIFSCAIEGED